jgi:Zn-dependent protease with chaperone function
VTTEPAEPSPPPAARLNPFVFPSDTTFRFLLLLVAVIGANLYIWSWLHTVIAVGESDYAQDVLECGSQYEATRSVATDSASIFAAGEGYNNCLQEANGELALAWWMLGGAALLLVVAGVILFLIPHWIVRRRRLRPLTRDEAPAVVDELGSLSREAGLDEEPRWLWSPLDPSPTGLAFGRPGTNSVALMGGLVTRQIADPPAFRAVVRHELAHLRNRDVDLTYATISLWYAFLLVGVLPFVLTIDSVDMIVDLGWRVGALALLVYLTRNAVLRAREVYADVRASVPDGPQGALRRILGTLPRASASLWRRLWRVYPDPQTRLAAVNDTRWLFPVGILVAFGLGVATTIAYESMVKLVAISVADHVTQHMLAAAVFVPLTMAAVGVGVWRSSWAALVENRVPPSTWPLALALGAGFVLGPELSLERIVPSGDETLLTTSLESSALWIAALLAGVVLLVAWVGGSAAAWIRALAGSRPPSLVLVAGLLVASGVLSVFVGVFFAIFKTGPVNAVSRELGALDYDGVSEVAWVGPQWFYQALWDTRARDVLTQPVVFASLVALWLFPLAAWRWRRDRVADAPWAFLEPGGRLRIPLIGRASFDWLWIGLIVGGASVAGLLVLRLGLRAGIDAETRAEFLFPIAFFHWQLMLALIAQAGAGVVAAARSRSTGIPLVLALAAAFVTACIATGGIVVGPSLAGCIEPIAMNPGPCTWDVDAGFAWLILRQIVAQGAVAAVAGGLVALGLMAIVSRRRAPVPIGAPG